MALRISDLEAMGVGSIVKDDVFEIENWAQRKSFRVSAQAIAEFCKTVNNGAYKGSTTTSLDEFTYQNAGVYFWSGTAPLVGMATSGILEILSSTPPSESPTEAPIVLERLISGNNIWCRSGYPGNWSTWATLTNKNGNKIFSGKDNTATVTFPAAFDTAPVVVCTPLNTPSNTEFYVMNVVNVTRTGFDVARFSLNMNTPKTVETTTNTYTTSGNEEHMSHSTQTVEVSNNAWSVVEGGQNASGTQFYYSWIATTDG